MDGPELHAAALRVIGAGLGQVAASAGLIAALAPPAQRRA
jgi:hypothetical protein